MQRKLILHVENAVLKEKLLHARPPHSTCVQPSFTPAAAYPYTYTDPTITVPVSTARHGHDKYVDRYIDYISY